MKKIIIIIFFIICNCKNKEDNVLSKNNFCNDLSDLILIEPKSSKNCDDFKILNSPSNSFVVNLIFNEKPFCTAFYIENNILLTAAHCVMKNGDYEIISSSGKKSKIKKIIVHPAAFHNLDIDFPSNPERSLTYIGDIALLQAAKSFMEIAAQKITIKKTSIPANVLSFTVGYGMTEVVTSSKVNWTVGYFVGSNLKYLNTQTLLTTYLRELDYIKQLVQFYEILDQKLNAHDAILYEKFKIPYQYGASELITVSYGGKKGGRCLSGDSGAPALVFDKNYNKHFAYAINSFGPQIFPTQRICGQTVIYPYLAWIKESVRALLSN